MNREELIEEMLLEAGLGAVRGGRPTPQSVERMKRALDIYEQAHTAHAKPFDTSPERSNNGADSSHVTQTDDERDGVAKAMCAIETRSKAASLEEVQAGIQRWMRHRYEAERLIEELADAGFEVRRTVRGEPTVFECPNCLIDVTPPAPDRENGSVMARDLLGVAGEDARSVQQIMTEMRGPRRATDRKKGSER